MRTVTRAGVTWKLTGPKPKKDFDWFCGGWESERWEPYTLDLIDRFVTPSSTLIDIGAWVGPISLWAARHHPRIIAVEPDPVALRHLYANLKRNLALAEVFAGALNDHSGTCCIQAHESGWGSSMTRVAPKGKVVPCITIADLFATYDITNCSLAKVDIEGAESIILEQLAPFCSERKIPLLVAMHEPWWSRPVLPSWFDGFSSVEGGLSGWGQVLALP